jgi:uncharacterized protein GlcG (DUF336 family)
VVVKREDGAGTLRPQIAHAKAWSVSLIADAG